MRENRKTGRHPTRQSRPLGQPRAKRTLRDPASSPSAILAGLDLIEVTVEKLVAGSEGLARVEGVPIFLPRTAPGDRVRARLVERRPQYGRAEVVELLAPGPGRRDPPCPHFARCGGCDLQHLGDTLQLELKVQAALEAFDRLSSGVKLPAPKVVFGSPWAYRLRTDLHTQPDGAGRQLVGYYERGSRRLVPVERCPVLVPELEQVLRELVAIGRERGGLPPRLGLASGSDGAITVAPPVEGFRSDAVAQTVAGLRFEFDSRCFFQAHVGLLDQLVGNVVGPWEGELAVDLYCGVGLFSLPLAQRYRRVVGVEGDAVAARFARRNARKSSLGNLEVNHRAVEGWALDGVQPLPDRVVLDPPRAGLPVGLVASLRKLRPPHVTMVSCHVATLARDVARLQGVYRIESLAFLDLFPQTGHLETVLQLVIA